MNEELDDAVVAPELDLLKFAIDSARSDVAYAIKQLREFKDHIRALDGLDRALESLTGTAVIPREGWQNVPVDEMPEITWSADKQEFGKPYLVDVPEASLIGTDRSEEVWTHMAAFKTREEALAYIRENVAECDDEGRVSLLAYCPQHGE